MLNDRNRLMVERMMPLMQRGSTFVGVGAGHLAGEEGILRLLEQRGYTVTRLR
ncbi:MAG: TraB/GumN family protein [Bacteroidota bacterium]